MLLPKPIHLLLFTFLLLFQTPIKAQILTWCEGPDGPSNFTSNDQFHTNLNLLLSSVITNTVPTLFYINSLGQNPDQVHILSQCTAGLSDQACRSCLNTSIVEILPRCPSRKDAILRYDDCVLRYSNQSFFSRVFIPILVSARNQNNVTDPVLFNRQLGSLMRSLSDGAASDESKFQTGVTNFTDFSNIYGLVQCTRDLSRGDCSSCLENLRNHIPACCDSKQGAVIVTVSCNIRYEIYRFFETPIEAEGPSLIWCDGPSNYTSNDQFHTNLSLLLSSLITNTLPTRFYNTTLGQNPDRVHMVAQCTAGLSNQVCRTCLNTSTVEILRRCPNRKDAIIRYDNCILRYSNESFFYRVDASVYVYAWSVDNVADPVRFNRRLESLIQSLSETAAASDESKFQTGSSDITGVSTIYGSVECTRTLSLGDCSSCLENLTNQIPVCCNSRQGAAIVTFGCNIRYDSRFFEASSSQPSPLPSPPPPQLAAEPPHPPPPVNGTSLEGSSQNSARTIVAIVVSGVIAVALISFVCFFLRRRKARKKFIDYVAMSSMGPLQCEFGTIAAATGNFCVANKLGEGGFGSVYKGTLYDGQEIAVKRLSVNSGQGAEEFKNEVELVAKLQHRNLVRLLGYCLEGEEKILIYEYIPNTSLDKFLFDPTKQATLKWDTRYKIIGGIARGLLYLHEDSRLRIVHRDLKASNILLDDKMTPKISDFGMARLFGVDQNEGSTNRIVGTYGYMSPEYAMHGQFSVKSDVYSFGVLLLEIVSGQKNSNVYQSNRGRDLPSYAWKKWTEGKALELIHPTVIEQCPQTEVMRCTHIGLLCVQEDVDLRPSMSSVVHMLSSYSVILPSPSMPGYFVRSKTKTNQYLGEPISCSVNEMSVTEFEPR